MPHEFATIGIFAKRDGEAVHQTIDALVRDLLRRGRRVLLDDHHTVAGADVEACTRADLGATCDLIVVVGGDGTLLNAGRGAAEYGTPLMGVNLGRLGFMVDVLPADMRATLDDILGGHYIAEPRLMLSARVRRAEARQGGAHFVALNECVIRNQAVARVLDFDTYMNGDFISHHRADGLVIATPTGSTAYALSGGGPVLHPGLSALAMVPICPHTLSDRPLIVDAAHQLEVRVASTHDGHALFSLDGQITQPLEPGDTVLIERSARDLTLIHPPGYDYFNILRNKLQWGRGQRTEAH